MRLLKCKYNLLIFLFINFSNLLFSANTISINDTTLKRGEIAEILIYADINLDTAKSLTLFLNFNALDIDIKSVAGNENFIMQCLNPIYDIKMNKFTDAKLTINCNKLDFNNKNILCKLIVEPLSGPDSVTYIKIDSIKINDKIQNDYEFKNAEIKIPGEPVFQDFPEGIGNNYPNPFQDFTVFPVIINKETKVQFIVYSLTGEFIISNKDLNNMLEVTFYNNDFEIPIITLNEKLQRGYYKIKLKPDVNQFSSGVYFFIMMTDNKVYHKNFVFMK